MWGYGTSALVKTMLKDSVNTFDQENEQVDLIINSYNRSDLLDCDNASHCDQLELKTYRKP